MRKHTPQGGWNLSNAKKFVTRFCHAPSSVSPRRYPIIGTSHGGTSSFLTSRGDGRGGMFAGGGGSPPGWTVFFGGPSCLACWTITADWSWTPWWGVLFAGSTAGLFGKVLPCWAASFAGSTEFLEGSTEFFDESGRRWWEDGSWLPWWGVIEREQDSSGSGRAAALFAGSTEFLDELGRRWWEDGSWLPWWGVIERVPDSSGSGSAIGSLSGLVDCSGSSVI